jgi:hypothetical protein
MAPICRPWPGLIEAYKDFLPVTDATPRITLLEGHTPLIESKRLAPQWAPNLRVFFKYEGLNPTGAASRPRCAPRRAIRRPRQRPIRPARA